MKLVTPGTRLGWSTLAQWLHAQAELSARPASSARHAALAAHLAALPDEIIEAADTRDLDQLDQVVRQAQPPRGQRAGHPTTRLLDAISRARAGGRQRRPTVERIIDDAIAQLRTRPPMGLTVGDVDAFVARWRPCLWAVAHAAGLHT